MGSKIHDKSRGWLRGNIRGIIITVILLAVIISSILFLSLYSISPTLVYHFSFEGESTLRHGDILYTFKPTILHNGGSDSLDFRITATNIGNVTRTFHFGDGDPTVLVYSPSGTNVNTLYKFKVSNAILYGHDLKPDQNYTIGWTWGSDSWASSFILPGDYLVSATWAEGLETSMVRMQVTL